MKHPTLLKANINSDEAEELMDYLYCEKVDYVSRYKDESISWFCEGELIAKWTKEYRNLMVSKDIMWENNFKY